MRMAPPDVVDRMSIDYLMWNAYVDGRQRADGVVGDAEVDQAVSAQVGHTDAIGPNQNTAPPLSSWNSAHANANCAADQGKRCQ